jgi:hypothetical protein
MITALLPVSIKGNFPFLSAIPGGYVGSAVILGKPRVHQGDIVITLVNACVCMLIGNLAGIFPQNSMIG